VDCVVVGSFLLWGFRASAGFLKVDLGVLCG